LEQIFPFSTPKDHYDFRNEPGCCIVWCSDSRFTPALEQLVRERGYRHYDLIRIPGGANDLASTNGENAKYTLQQIALLRRIHNFSQLILMMHQDCAACGGSPAFGNDYEREVSNLSFTLESAEMTVKGAIPGLQIEKVLVTFSGVSRVQR